MNRNLMNGYYHTDSQARNVTESSEKINNEPKMELSCNCNRSPETIQCRGCGKSFVGRKRILCQKHRNTIHLMDFSFCVFCKKRLE
ncbi:hypothetical protein AWC38_SpisGene1660 [Stylophora pistillata]|uniref:Uncharacterized protein n=1 Tax=Stylophora pistillata TaxID=50429 RepID=A0A2B4SVP4_STYPI|nr:hypothetical protein AWC38_SpisGene1660 [Stylophora pistillata]